VCLHINDSNKIAVLIVSDNIQVLVKAGWSDYYRYVDVDEETPT
jgi:hypothetical protein